MGRGSCITRGAAAGNTHYVRNVASSVLAVIHNNIMVHDRLQRFRCGRDSRRERARALSRMPRVCCANEERGSLGPVAAAVVVVVIFVGNNNLYRRYLFNDNNVVGAIGGYSNTSSPRTRSAIVIKTYYTKCNNNNNIIVSFKRCTQIGSPATVVVIIIL